MPTYEFRCPDGHDFEKFYRSIGAAPTEVLCPTCSKVAGRQLSAGGGLLFKGSGFYITDYGKDGKKSQAPVAGKSDSTKPADDATASKPDSGAADKGSAAGTGDAGSPSAPSESKTAAAPAKKPKTAE